MVVSASTAAFCCLAERDLCIVTSCWVLGCFGCCADFAGDEARFRRYQKLEADRRRPRSPLGSPLKAPVAPHLSKMSIVERMERDAQTHGAMVIEKVVRGKQMRSPAARAQARSPPQPRAKASVEPAPAPAPLSIVERMERDAQTHGAMVIEKVVRGKKSRRDVRHAPMADTFDDVNA